MFLIIDDVSITTHSPLGLIDIESKKAMYFQIIRPRPYCRNVSS